MKDNEKNFAVHEIFRNYLRDSKYRITPERFEVLDYALESSEHFGADDLFIRMKNDKSHISRATVYNTLELLANCDILSKRNFGENLNRYEVNYKRKSHDHIVCTNCGKIYEFSSNKIHQIISEVCAKYDVEYSGYSFNIYGKCKTQNNCGNN